MTCARFPSALCVIGEPTEDGKHLIVGVSISSREEVRSSFGLLWLKTTIIGVWTSPDGTRVAVTRTLAGPIYILSLAAIIQQFQVKG